MNREGLGATQSYKDRLVRGHRQLGEYLKQESPPLVLVEGELQAMLRYVNGALQELGIPLGQGKPGLFEFSTLRKVPPPRRSS